MLRVYNALLTKSLIKHSLLPTQSDCHEVCFLPVLLEIKLRPKASGFTNLAIKSLITSYFIKFFYYVFHQSYYFEKRVLFALQI